MRAFVTGLALWVLAGGAAAAQPAAPPPAAGTPAIPTTGVSTQDPAQLRDCQARFKAIGLPRHRSEDRLLAQVPVCRDGWAASFNCASGNPDWVMEHLTPARVRGTAVRKDRFRPDGWVSCSPTKADYLNFGYDRGHQAPAADASFSQQAMDDSFFMTNMSPQVGDGFNSGQWKYLEEAVRAWVLCGGRDDVMVMTGPIYGTSTKRIGARQIRVPQAYYKIVYDLRSGRAVGFRLENQPYKKTPVGHFIVPISDIEDATGLDFFPALSRRAQAQIETPKGLAWGHDQSCSA
ncbi:MAG: DNA/RNA non-specific endonuclease [Caulobacter sp.]